MHRIFEDRKIHVVKLETENWKIQVGIIVLWAVERLQQVAWKNFPRVVGPLLVTAT